MKKKQMNHMTDDDHMVFGRLSGIPDCCIHFYVNHWEKMSRYKKNKYEDKFIGPVDPETGRVTRFWNYVPCPECIIKKYKVEIVSCSFLKNFRRETPAEQIGGKGELEVKARKSKAENGEN